MSRKETIPTTKGETMKIAFCQISNTLINPEPEDEYTKFIYSQPGFKKPADFWEIPLWVAKMSYSIPEGELYVVKSVAQAVKDLSKYDAVCFSVLEVNRKLVLTIVADLPCHIKVVLGGYVKNNFKSLERFNIHWFDTLQAGVEFLGFKYQEGVSYKLFKGIGTIPRLSLSDGCLYRCKFCCVEKTLKEYTLEATTQNIDAMRDLDFELVYINDKTYGQATNHRWVKGFFYYIKSFNPNFKGFIIQTTAVNFLKLDSDLMPFIAYVELGVESFNNNILKAMNKPHREKQVKDACWKIFDLQTQGLNIQLIPNILVSLPGETKATYQKTLDFLKNVSKIVSHANIYSLALYPGAALETELVHTEQDKNENSVNKSWSNPGLDNWFMKGIKNA